MAILDCASTISNGLFMNKHFFLLLVLFFFWLPHGLDAKQITSEQKNAARQEYPTDTLYQLWLDYNQDKSSLGEFYDSLSEQHIVEVSKKDPSKAIVTYFAKGNEDTDYFMQSGGPDFYGLRFKQIANSHYYFCTQSIPLDARFNYGINEFIRMPFSGTSTGDQHELYKTSMRHVYDGSVFGPDAKRTAYTESDATISKGKLKSFNIMSKYLNQERKLLVYLPANYDPAMAHNLIVQLDGENYSSNADHAQTWRGWTPMPTILDNLIAAKKIKPTIAIFVFNQGSRSQDMLSERFTKFIGQELIPWINNKYNLNNSDNTGKTIISGPSRAAFAAIRAALKYPDHINGVLSQSGSFYYTQKDKENWPIYPEYEGKLLSDIKQLPKQPVRFYLDVGLYDLGLARVGTNRQLKDILILKGYDVVYKEYKGGHSHLNWRLTLSDGLIALLGDH